MAKRLTGNTSFLNLMKLDDNAYLKNRLKYHATSRIGIQTGQALAQATNTDGHTVRYGQVWTAKDNEFAVNTGDQKTTTNGITANQNLVSVFKGNPFAPATSEPFAYNGSNDTIAVTGKTYYSYDSESGKYTKLEEGEDKDWKAGDSLIGRNYYEDAGKGTIWTNKNYPAIKLFEQCEMNTVSGSNGSGSKFESYELTYGSSRVMDWVAPTSVKDNGLPVPGYTARIEALKGSTWTDLEKCTDGAGAWALAEGNWEFAYISGMCTFHPSNTPAQYSYTKLRITAFQYVGSYLNNTLDSLSENVSNNMMAIQPFKFNPMGMKEARENVYVIYSENADLDGVTLYEDSNNPGTYSAAISSGDIYRLYTIHSANDLLHGNEERYYFDFTEGDSTSVVYFKRGQNTTERTTLAGEYGVMMAKGTAMESTLFTIMTESEYAYEKYKVSSGSLYLVLPCIVFNVFNSETGLAYGDLTYLDDADAGKTLIVFEDWDSEMFSTNDTFFAYGFVRGDGNVLPIKDMDRSHHWI